MSDDHGDAEFEASLAGLGSDGDAGGGSGGDPAAARPDEADPGLASRLEAVHGTLSALGMRIDALVTSTTSYRAALTDRLTEYSEVVAKSARNQAADLEEYRRTTERTVGDVRRGLTATEESLRAIGERLDQGVGSASGGDADGDRRVLAEIRSILDAHEQLSDFLTQSLDKFGTSVVEHLQRQGAGLSEDIAQLRAIASAVAERDVTDDLRGLRTAVDDLAGRDLSTVVAAEVQPIAAELERLAGLDVPGVVRAELRPVAELVEHLAAQVADTTADERVADRIGALTESVDALVARDRSDEIVTRLETLVTTRQVDQLSGDLAARLADAVGGLDGRALNAELAGVREILAEGLGKLRDEVSSNTDTNARTGSRLGEVEARVQLLLDRSSDDDVSARFQQLDERLLDVASGEVMGALWDEVRSLREGLAADTTATIDDDTRALLDQVVAEVGTLRADLTEGLEVEHGEWMSSSLEAVRADVQAIIERLDEGLVLAEDEGQPIAAPAPAGPAPEAVIDRLAGLQDLVVSQLDVISGQVETLRAQLPTEAPPAPEPPAPAEPAPVELVLPEDVAVSLDPDDLDLLRDEIRKAALPDDLVERMVERLAERLQADLRAVTPDEDRVEDRVEQVMERMVARVRDEVRDAVEDIAIEIVPPELPAPAPQPSEPQPAAPAGPVFAELSPDALDVLRADLRTAGGPADDLVASVRDELKALRRRLAVKAEENVLTDAQLGQIADAVVARLAAERPEPAPAAEPAPAPKASTRKKAAKKSSAKRSPARKKAAKRAPTKAAAKRAATSATDETADGDAGSGADTGAGSAMGEVGSDA